MKNLKNQKNLSFLPRREPIKKPDSWGRGSTCHKVDGRYPWDRVHHLCESNIGRSFDKVFSIYCSQVPVYQQDWFLDEFKNKRYWTNKYYVDEQGRIQKNKKPKKDRSVTFYSDDYRTEWRHKETGKIWVEDPWWYTSKYNRNDYEEVIEEGWSQKFSSVKDPEYMRLSIDQKKRRKAIERKTKIEKEYSFVSQSEKDAKKEKAKDKVKIEGKGFDYITSFRTEKQTNPDTIKNNQNF